MTIPNEETHKVAAELKSHTIVRDDPLTVTALDDVDAEGAHITYTVGFPLPAKDQFDGVTTGRDIHFLRFQNGPITNGPNGITDEALLSIVAHRMACRAKKNPHDQYFRMAMGKTREALATLHSRTADRKMRGVEGTILA